MAKNSLPGPVLLLLVSLSVTVVFLSGWHLGVAEASNSVTPWALTEEVAGELGPPTEDTVVATVNGEALTLGELLLRYASLPAMQRFNYESSGRKLAGFLEDLAGDLVLEGAARELGVDHDPLFGPLVELHQKQIRRDLLARRVVLAQIDDTVLRARYEEQRADRFQVAPQRRVRQILVTATKEEAPFNSTGDDAVGTEAAQRKARQLRARVTTETFAELAAQYSEGVEAGEGGDLGWVTAGTLNPALAKAVFSLSLDEVSEVIETPLGWHLVQVVEVQPGGSLPFEVVRELLFQEIVGEQLPYLANLGHQDRAERLAEAEVELFVERLPR